MAQDHYECGPTKRHNYTFPHLFICVCVCMCVGLLSTVHMWRGQFVKFLSVTVVDVSCTPNKCMHTLITYKSRLDTSTTRINSNAPDHFWTRGSRLRSWGGSCKELKKQCCFQIHLETGHFWKDRDWGSRFGTCMAFQTQVLVSNEPWLLWSLSLHPLWLTWDP